jgi:hypothetical protein
VILKMKWLLSYSSQAQWSFWLWTSRAEAQGQKRTNPSLSRAPVTLFYHPLQYNILSYNDFVFRCNIEQHFTINDIILGQHHFRKWQHDNFVVILRHYSQQNPKWWLYHKPITSKIFSTTIRKFHCNTSNFSQPFLKW